MPRLNIPITVVTNQGVTKPAEVTGVAADDLELDPVLDSDVVWVEVRNSDASPRDVVVDVNYTYDGFALSDITESVPAGGQAVILLRPLSYFLQSDGKVYINVANDSVLHFRAFSL